MPLYAFVLRDGTTSEDFVFIDGGDGRVTPIVGGQQLRDGGLVSLKGREWLAEFDSANADPELIRFICTPVTHSEKVV